jgi:hypothetical protein
MPDQSELDADVASSAWLYDPGQANAPRHSSDRATRAEAAVDRLLASYWV